MSNALEGCYVERHRTRYAEHGQFAFRPGERVTVEPQIAGTERYGGILCRIEVIFGAEQLITSRVPRNDGGNVNPRFNTALLGCAIERYLSRGFVESTTNPVDPEVPNFEITRRMRHINDESFRRRCDGQGKQHADCK